MLDWLQQRHIKRKKGHFINWEWLIIPIQKEEEGGEGQAFILEEGEDRQMK